jgi:hypothetical protein
VDCNNRFGSDSAAWIDVFPLYDFWILVVLTDIAQEFSFEVRNGSKYTAGDDVSFNLGKPKLDLVEPMRSRL